MTPQLMRDCLRDEIKSICAYTKVAPSELFSTKRSQRVLRARKCLARELANRGLSTPRIGQILGRHHTSVLGLLGRVSGKVRNTWY